MLRHHTFDVSIMKKTYIIYLTILSVLLSCTTNDPLEGIWIVRSDYYRATCEIHKTYQGFQGLMLSYDDGTTIYKHDPQQPRHLFKNIKLKDREYVDGVSSATIKSGTSKNISIKLINEDSLLMTTYIMNRPVEELWTKINKDE